MKVTKLIAPWTIDQVANLNRRQLRTDRHPYTCDKDHRGVLVATTRGWICPFCEYTQNWAHPDDANPAKDV